MLRQVARLYIEVMRGVPIIVLLLYVAFVLVPGLVAAWNWIAVRWADALRTRDLPLAVAGGDRADAGLFGLSGRDLPRGPAGGGQGPDRGGQALGLNGWQRFRHVVFPQAFRMILPPLGNDFVAMVKDSSLVAVLGVSDITQLAKVTAAGNFRYFETYNVAALLYLTMTIGLIAGVAAARGPDARARGRETR